MAGDVFDRCRNCNKLRYLHNGYCSDCASFKGATTPGGSIFGSGFSSRPKCRDCGGTGKIVHFLGPDEVCKRCGGTGKE